MTPLLDQLHRGSQKTVWQPKDAVGQVWLEGTTGIGDHAEIVSSAFIFGQLNQATWWHDIASAPVLKPFDSNWLDRRWQHLIFSHVISEHGLPNHFQELVNGNGESLTVEDAAKKTDSVYLKATAADLLHPKACNLNGQTVYDYPYSEPTDQNRILPLDIFFHFGLPSGSLLKDRLGKDPSYAKRLGLDKSPIPLSWFERPVLEYCARFEPSQRILNLQEALLISGLTAGQFEEMIETSYLVALGLQVLCAKGDLILWAGKLQYAVSKEGLLLINTLGPRELLLGYADVILPGHKLPQIYRAIDLGKQKETDLDSTACGLIANQVTNQQLFTDLPTLKELSQRLREEMSMSTQF